MATTENGIASTGEDDAAIVELHEIVERQRAAFLADPFPSLEERQELLGALAGMLIGHRTQIQEALSSDFGVHPTLAADLIEVLGPAGRAVYAAEQLGSWMAPEPRHADPALYGSGRAFVQPQPKGVIGNIVPWNFPFDLSVGPLIEMLAAGNRVVIKPSEYTPACGGAAARDGPRDVRPRPRRRGRRRPGARAGVHARSLGSPALHRQPGDRPRDRQGRGRAARAGDARARRQVPGDPHRRQRRRRVGQAGARDQGAQERPDVHLGRLLPRPARAAGGLRAASRPTTCASRCPATASSDSCTGIISSRHLERIQGLLEDARARRLRRAAAGGGGRRRSGRRASCRCRS